MGFAAEVKDFLNAWQSGEKINASRTDREYKDALTDAAKKKTVRDNDPDTLALQDETARAKLKHIQTQTGATGANAALINERRNALRLQQDLIKKQSMAPGGGSGLLPGADGTGALPLQSTISLGDDEPQAEFAAGGAVPEKYSDAWVARQGSTVEDQEERDASFPSDNNYLPLTKGAIDVDKAKRSDKMKRLFEDGGLVPEEEPVAAAPEEDVAEEPAIPVGGGAPTDISARSKRTGLEGIVSPQLVHDATKAGLTWGANAFGLGQVGGIRTNQQKLAAQKFAQGAGGLSDEEMAAVKKSIDPEGKMSDAQRNMAALGSVYQYQLNKGNPDGAQRVAFQMLQHYRVASQRYGAIAAQAAQSGNLDLATKAAVKAYANIPDGRDIEIFKDEDGKLNYSYTDASTGKTIAKGLLTPQQLASSAMGLAQGGFDKAILTAAGARANPDGKKEGALKTTDRKNIAAMANEPVEKFEEEYKARMEKEKLQPLDPEYLGRLKDATQHFLSDNPKATAREAFKAAQALYTLDKDDPGKENFKVQKLDDEEGMNKVKFNSGHSLKLSDDQLEPILLYRAAQLKAQDTKDDAEADAADEPGLMDKVGAVGKAVGNAAVDVAKRGGPMAIAREAAYGALPQDLKNGAAAVGRYAGEAIDNGTWDLRQALGRGADALSNKGALPIDAPL